MIPEPGILSADEAIEKAFAYFEKYVERGQRLSHVLLEELEYLGEGNGWRVVVGFDIGRTKKTNANPVLFGEEKNEPIREFRSFIISEVDGSLIKLTQGLGRILLDTGPLVALLVGRTDRSKLGNRRVREYSEAMYDRLADLARDTGVHVSLPNILTEVSNHIGAGQQQITEGIVNALGAYVIGVDEIYQPSSDIVAVPAYLSMGITDTAILSTSRKLIRDRVNVVTQDHELFNRLTQVGVECTNVMHWRTPRSRL